MIGCTELTACFGDVQKREDIFLSVVGGKTWRASLCGGTASA